VDAIREQVPDKSFMLSIKINSADFTDGVRYSRFLCYLFTHRVKLGLQGFSEEESRQTIVRLEENGFDLIELSGGTYESSG
jgi:2,4-dienoyl-CoA reductase-like NADH-dependent reductase (Old Yellow Enzyme family)